MATPWQAAKRGFQGFSGFTSFVSPLKKFDQLVTNVDGDIAT
jgi:hypothetical protein